MNELEGMINGLMSNPEEMKKIMNIASSLMGGGDPVPGAEAPSEAPPLADLMSGLGNIPEGVMGMAKKLLGGSGGDGGGSPRDKAALLEAMKPWLSEKRQSKLDRAIKIAKVMRMAGGAFLKDGG